MQSGAVTHKPSVNVNFGAIPLNMLHVFNSEDEVNKMLKKYGYDVPTAQVKAWWWQLVAFAWIMAIEVGKGRTNPQRFGKGGGGSLRTRLDFVRHCLWFNQ